MTEDDLFQNEARFLREAADTLASGALSAEVAERLARTAIAHLDRLLTVSRRLVRHADRSEARLRERHRALRELSARLAYQSRHDGLTGLLNRSSFVEHAARVLREERCALVLLDVDFFKSINDRFGHPVGDAVLRAFADVLRGWAGTLAAPSWPDGPTVIGEPVDATSWPVGDYGEGATTVTARDAARLALGRLGGEEFGVVIAGPPDLQWAHEAVARLLDAVRALRIESELGLRVTASAGAVWVEPPGLAFEAAYVCGDDALYRAKVAGRNWVEWVADCLARNAA